MTALLQLVLGFALLVGSAQQPPPKDASPEFVALANAWSGALNDYAAALRRFDHANVGLPPEKRDPQAAPPHPAGAWWKRFEPLARAGDPEALEWQVEEAPHAFALAAQRADAAEAALRELLRTHPGHRAVEPALIALRGLLESFGRERLVALLRLAHEQAQGSENQARALALEAWALGERANEVGELQDEILLVHPGTRAAREVAGVVFSRLEQQFVQAELGWVASVRALQAQGRPVKDWPPQPMHAWQQKYLPVAAAGGVEATEFIEHVYPAYQQAEGNDMGRGLVWLQRWWMLYAPAGDADWLRARLGLIEVVARQYHGRPLLVGALSDLAQYSGALPLPELEAALAPALADDSDPAAPALAHFTHAAALSRHNQWADWQAARAELELLLQRFGTQEIAARAREQLTLLTNVWPGSKAHDFRGSDQQGHEFRLEDSAGSVRVLDFGSATSDFGAEEIARRRELMRSFAGRPLRWIGGLIDSGNARMFREGLGAAGVDWPCALLGSRDSDIGRLWSLDALPAVFVVDAQGVIRARNLPWAELPALLETLVREAEQRHKPR